MSTKFSMTRDINGYNGFGIIPSQDIFGCTLTANAAQSFVVPNNNQYWIAVFSYTPGANIWVDFSGAATVPGSTMGSITSVLNPSGRQVKGGSTISFITADTSTPFVCCELQVINNYASIT